MEQHRGLKRRQGVTPWYLGATRLSQHPKTGTVVQEGPLPAEVYAKEEDASSSPLGLEVTVICVFVHVRVFVRQTGRTCQPVICCFEEL